MEEISLEIFVQLSNVSLTELLSNSLRDSLGLTMNNQWDEQIHQDRVHELYYGEINKNETNPVLLQHFIQDWKTIYEQLSLQHDYNALRSELATKDSYNITAKLDELMDDVHTPLDEPCNTSPTPRSTRQNHLRTKKHLQKPFTLLG
ncbi:hypothetical protein ACOQFO_02090 [Ureibacillus sp. MALMAid1270]|uniref:hypothetical protein n=1 Tax=Ureibacillus sp. MALMAid1270 TaxID=3411629 RepID=UPI003BA756FE